MEEVRRRTERGKAPRPWSFVWGRGASTAFDFPGVDTEQAGVNRAVSPASVLAAYSDFFGIE
jgi:hypothetical protein